MFALCRRPSHHRLMGALCLSVFPSVHRSHTHSPTRTIALTGRLMFEAVSVCVQYAMKKAYFKTREKEYHFFIIYPPLENGSISRRFIIVANLIYIATRTKVINSAQPDSRSTEPHSQEELSICVTH